MTIKEVLQSDKKVQFIKIKVIVNHGDNSIVGDATGLAICCASNTSFRDMKEGQCYQILKPIKKDQDTFTPNEKLKPFKIVNFPLTPKKPDLSKLQALLQSKSEDKHTLVERKDIKLTSFNDLEKLAPKSEIKAITAKVVHLSKDIAGSYGSYNIAKLKDINCIKMDINIYNHKLKIKFKIGDVVELKNLKITEFSKDDQTFRRLVTTSRSSGEKSNSDIEALFKEVPLGDKREDGKIVAIHDIFTYLSCSKCWKKTAEEDTSCSCGNSDNINIKDFTCKLYIETTKDENIEVIHTFRRQTNLDVTTLIHDDIEAILEDKLLNKRFTFEWNISFDEEDLKMVKITEADPTNLKEKKQ